MPDFKIKGTKRASTEVIPITGIFEQNVNVQEGQKTKYSQRGIFICFEQKCLFMNTFPKMQL